MQEHATGTHSARNRWRGSSKSSRNAGTPRSKRPRSSARGVNSPKPNKSNTKPRSPRRPSTSRVGDHFTSLVGLFFGG